MKSIFYLGVPGEDDLDDFNKKESDDYTKEGFPYDEDTLGNEGYEDEDYDDEDWEEADAEARQNQE
jgi:hypothetical protein